MNRQTSHQEVAPASGADRSRSALPAAAFTLLELLIAVAIIALLISVLLPSLSRARRQAAAVVCQSNIRQLVIANDLYARDCDCYVPGAAREMSLNLDRWHGRRQSINQRFDAVRGPLAPYLGHEGKIRACPVFETASAPNQSALHFEAGCGGYGYNHRYLGVADPVRLDNGERSSLSGAKPSRVRRPVDTLMFADSAFAAEALIEYSFAEPRFHPQYGGRADPSIHFRHDRATHAAWCDGHVTPERRTFTWSSGLYSLHPDRFDIGWFGTPDDNSRFDLQ